MEQSAKRRPKKKKATLIEPPPEEAKLWTMGQVSFVLGLAPGTIQRLARESTGAPRDFPKPIVVGRQQHRWKAEVIVAYIAHCEAEAAE